MKKILCLLLFPMMAHAEYALVAHTSATYGTVSKADLKQIFTGSKSQLGGGKVIPCRLSSESATGGEFLKDAIGMTSAEYERFWLEQELSGRGTAPKKLSSPQDAVDYASNNAGALCFTDKSAATAAGSKIKMISVN